MDRIIRSADVDRIRQVIYEFQAKDDNKSVVFHLALFIWCTLFISVLLIFSLLGSGMSGWGITALSIFFFALEYGSTFFLIHSTRELLRVSTGGGIVVSPVPQHDPLDGDDNGDDHINVV